jgi:E3 ubiquitin-protein ligase HOS1
LLDNLETEEMKTRLSLLLKLSVHLVGISNVLEVLESSFKDSLSAQLHDLQLLLENILKAKQVWLLTGLSC